jgi:hypothetical protein
MIGLKLIVFIVFVALALGYDGKAEFWPLIGIFSLFLMYLHELVLNKVFKDIRSEETLDL